MDRATNRIFSGCSKKSVVVDATTGKVVAEIANGDGVDALGWDQAQKLIYIPAAASGNVTVVHEDSPDKYTVVATVPTMTGAKTDRGGRDEARCLRLRARVRPGTPAATPGGRATRRGPIIGAWLISIKH